MVSAHYKSLLLLLLLLLLHVLLLLLLLLLCNSGKSFPILEYVVKFFTMQLN